MTGSTGSGSTGTGNAGLGNAATGNIAPTNSAEPCHPGKRILVIRLGALGDFVLSFPAFADIRGHHAQDRITLLTTAPFVSLALESPWFDQVRVDARPSWFDPLGLWRLRRQLRGFDRIYDLQTSRRSSRYFLLAGQPEWSGIARGATLQHDNPHRNALHTVSRQREQLAQAGVPPSSPPALGWLASGGPAIAHPYALIVPGTSAAHGGAKRWPAERYVALADNLAVRGLRPVVVGGPGDAAQAQMIQHAVPETISLAGRTSLQDLAGLAARAAVTIGGDTGPVHLAAMMGCPVVALFSRFSNPDLAAPIGRVTLLQAPSLADLPVERVVAALPAF
jgi:ADP-heptose:LPS heptosyltransferase